jgi:hypothetical protein
VLDFHQLPYSYIAHNAPPKWRPVRFFLTHAQRAAQVAACALLPYSRTTRRPSGGLCASFLLRQRAAGNSIQSSIGIGEYPVRYRTGHVAISRRLYR